ncbi:hypothetical protein BKA67DRAFT_663980 [Truncatella angustata]|uniref:Uncharacterized protein n=1 Tax=Truncatella angustata TaxID=152316 RepID=A0A9P8RMU0_9PEZI|nr:uncharacterized protein BKA67DRAFT_663980 [Truncatella angustata]KAH6646120.1 hypothetical protein BKA67DRAFT_663980 [Truncatella angustata]
MSAEGSADLPKEDPGRGANNGGANTTNNIDAQGLIALITALTKTVRELAIELKRTKTPSPVPPGSPGRKGLYIVG